MDNTIKISINWTDPTFLDQYSQSKIVDLNDVNAREIPIEIKLVGGYKVTIEKIKNDNIKPSN